MDITDSTGTTGRMDIAGRNGSTGSSDENDCEDCAGAEDSIKCMKKNEGADSTGSNIGSMITLFPLLQSTILVPMKGKEHCTRLQLQALLALYTYGDLTMSQLSWFISASKEQATRTVAPLAAVGYVERKVPEDNRKLVIVKLTEEGKDFLLKVKRSFQDCFRKHMEESLTPEESRKLTEALRVVIPLLNKIR